MKFFQVGGSVRDFLMGRTPSDIDWVVVGGSEKEMLEKGFSKVGSSFQVFIHPKTREEYALARKEKKTGSGHQGFSTETDGVSLEEDLGRRDLTINSIARADDGSVVDPFRGADDIRNRVLRHTSDAFNEDPLRVFRVARFGSYFPDFTVHPETMERMQGIVQSDDFQTISSERIWAELEKVLTNSSDPWRFFEILHECRADEVVFSEIDDLWGVEQPKLHHAEGAVDKHMSLVMKRVCELSDSPVTRFAALVHDLGKGATPKDQLPKHIGHEKAGVPLVASMCHRISAPSKFCRMGMIVAGDHLRFHRILEMRPGSIVELLDRLKVRHGLENATSFMHACIADASGRIGGRSDYTEKVKMFTECIEAYNSVSISSIKPDKRHKAFIKDAIYQERCQAVSAVKRRIKNARS